MFHFKSRRGVGLALTLAAAAMGACTPGEQLEVVTIKGVASEGSAIAYKGVGLRDAKGMARFGTTDASGAFTIEIQGLSRPFMLQVVGSQGSAYHSFYTAGDEGKPANVNDDTDSIAQLVLSESNGGLQRAFNYQTFAGVTAERVSAADAAFLAKVKSDFDGAGALLTESPRIHVFNPGNTPGGGDDYNQLMAAVSLVPDGSGGFVSLNTKPEVVGAVTATTYDGVTDDLLTGGLGKTGLLGGTPAYANPASPTAAELRRNAIYANYRALVDANPNGGFGTLYGPNVDKDGNATSSEGKVAGAEYIAFADDGSGKKNVTVMVQVPSTFDPAHPCIVTGTSSGSRGVYGHIGLTGDWGLKRGCAVAYSDKGSGNGMHDLQNDTVNLITGVRATAAAAGNQSLFTASLSASEKAAFNTATPNRVAFKHAHSQQNPEKDWGRNTLDSILFAFHVLNERFSPMDASGRHVRSITPANTIVLSAGVSNGGGAALAAGEQDVLGLIDGVVAGEPQIQLGNDAGLTLKQGSTVIGIHGKSLLDIDTYAGLYQPCAAIAASAVGSPGAALLSTTSAANRCAALKSKGLLSGDTTAAQADEALSRVLAYGWPSEATLLNASHYSLALTGVIVTYANAYGRFSVRDNLCGFSYAATDASGAPVPLAANAEASVFATANGVPPTAGVNIVYNDAMGGAKRDVLAVSLSTGQADFALDGALCLRSLVTGTDPVTGAALTGDALARSQRVQAGIAEVLASANLRGKPTILVQGRADTLEPVNHTSRPYYGKNLMVEGTASKIHYYEVTNAQHFDTFIDNPSTPGYDTRFVPLHRYFTQSLNLMFDALRSNAALPPSQVVRTIPRGGTPGQAPAITTANVPPIATTPAAADQISFSANTVVVPD